MTTRRLWLLSPCRTGLCPVFLCLLTVAFFGVVRVSRPPSPSDSLPGQFLCSGGFLLDHQDLIMGSEWLFFRHRWMPLSCALGFSRCMIVHDGSPRVASPFLFPRPESQGGFLDCVSHSLSCPGALRFPSFFSSVGGWVKSGRFFSLELWSPSSACGGCGSRSVPSPFRGSPGYLPSRQGTSVSGFVPSASPYLGLVPQVLVHSLIVDFSSKFLDARRTCRVAFPSGGCRCLPSGLARRSVHSVCSWLSAFLSQVTALPPSPCFSGFSGMLHVLLSSLSLQSCAWFILPLRPVLLGRRCWISSAPRFVGFTVPTVQTRAKSHWEPVGFSREVRFSLPVSAPRRLHWS